MGNFTSREYSATEALLADQSAKYTVECEEVAEPGFGIPRRSAKLKQGAPLQTKFVTETGEKSASTLWELLEVGESSSVSGLFLGTRKYIVEENPEFQASDENRTGKSKSYKPSGYKERTDGTVNRFEYVFDTYAEVKDAATAVGYAFRDLGIEPKSNVGIFSVNRAEWVLSELAIYSQSMHCVPLYATLGPDAVEYIIKHAEIPLIVVSKENLPSLKKSVKNFEGIVKHIVMIDSIFDGRYGNTLDTVSTDNIDFFAEHDIVLHGLSSLIKTGKELYANDKYSLTLPQPDTTAFVMYTSGTTGAPKGVLLTHKSVVAGAAGVPERLGYLVPGDTYLSVLPLAHIFETVAQGYIWGCGATVYFSQGDIRRLADDLQTCKPTMFAGVPRIFQKFYENVWKNISNASFIKRWFVNRAYNNQLACLREGRPLDITDDQRVFSKIRELIGFQNLKVGVSGAAPCPPYILEFMRVLTNAHFAEGYGLTESCAGTAISSHPQKTLGHCGSPLINCMVKLADIPEMGYTSTSNPPCGEILIAGDTIFSCYYKDEKSTTESVHIDPNGVRWFRTGDVGRWNPNGSLSIIDRKKNMIKLAQGEYVALERLEDTYGKAQGIAQIWIYGSSYKSMLVSVIVPDWQYAYEHAVANGWWKDASVTPKAGDHSEEFVQALQQLFKDHHDDFVAVYAENLKMQEGTLLGFEKIKKFAFEAHIDNIGNGFTEDKGTLTPTMKKKRKQLTEAYLPVLKKMYEALGEPHKEGENW